MNSKKLGTLLGLSSILVMGAAHAGWQGNFLLGAEGGYAWRNATFQNNVFDNLGAPTFDFNDRYRDDEFVGGVLAGYQVICRNLLLGLEGHVTWQGSDDDRFYQTDSPAGLIQINARHKRGTVYGLTARVGYKISDWMMPYLRAGVETSRDKIEVSVNDVTAPVTHVFGIDQRRSVGRFVGGAGLEFPFLMDSVARVEYRYSARGRGAEGSSLDALGGGNLLNSRIKPHQHAALLALVWNFN